MGSKKWKPDCVVTARVPGKRFAFDVKAGPFKVAGWAYELAAPGSGCLVTELQEDHRGRWRRKPGCAQREGQDARIR
jgi:hypothetical protein